MPPFWLVLLLQALYLMLLGIIVRIAWWACCYMLGLVILTVFRHLESQQPGFHGAIP